MKYYAYCIYYLLGLLAEFGVHLPVPPPIDDD